MAPPNRRKQRPAPSSSSSSSPIPLAGVALGLFAAIAAGFAASRAFRKRRPARLQEQAIPAGKDSSIPLPLQDREIEIKKKNDPKPSPFAAVINEAIAVPHEPAKLGLNPVFEACEEASIQEKNGAKASEEGGGGEEEEEEVKRAVTDEEGEIGEGEGEAIQITVEVNAVVLNEASMEALQEANLVEEEEEEENDGDDERLAEQQPSPVLINGKVLDFNEEIIADSKEDHDRLSSGSYSISDALSESSLQEVSSAPVKPLPAEEAQITWPEIKPDFVVAEEEVEVEEDVKEGKLWPDLEENLPELEKNLPELENSLPQMEKNLPDLNHDWPESKQSLPDSKPVSVEADGELLDLKPVWVEIKEEGVSAEKLNRPNNEAMSRLVDVKGDGVVLEGEVSVDIGSGKRILEAVGINDKVLSDEQLEIEAPDFSQPAELSTSKAISDGEPDLQLAREGSDDTGFSTNGEPYEQLAQEGSDDTGFSTNGEPYVQSVKEGSDDNTGSSTNGEPNLQLAQEGTSTLGDPLEELGNHGGPLEEPGSSTNGSPNLQLAQEGTNTLGDPLEELGNGGPLEEPGSSTNGEPNLQLAQEGTSTLGDPLEELGNGGPLEEPVSQSHGQNLDSVDGTCVDNPENNLDTTEQDQPSSLIASTEAKACQKEISSSTKDDDGPAETLRGEEKPRFHVQQQEIEEITSSLDINDQIFESKKLASSTNGTLVYGSNTREADQLAPSAIAQEVGLQSKGGFESKIHEFAPYLPLEMVLICLLIALVSFVLWYLGISSPGQE